MQKTFDGEAAKNLLDEIRLQILRIAWSKVVGTRNDFAHAYFGLSQDMIWDVVQARIPELIAAVAAIPSPPQAQE